MTFGNIEKYDAVVIGAGPVGLMFSTCLARWGYKIKHIDNRPHPTTTGRADGIQPRSLDLLRNMGLKQKLMEAAPAKVYEVAFWDPSKNGITRTGTWASCPKFIDARYPFTTLLHQGYIEEAFIEDMEKNGVTIQRPWTITGFKNDGKDQIYPVEVNIAHVDGKATETIRAKYLFSGEGARSFVREQLKIATHYMDQIAHVWGVMDGVVRTDFPDIKVSYVQYQNLYRSDAFLDEMYNSLRCRLHYGYSKGRQHGPAVHSNCIINRPRFRPEENGLRGRGYGSSKKDLQAVLCGMGPDRMVLGLSYWTRDLRKVHPGRASVHGRRCVPYSQRTFYPTFP
jgi:hypothetical protein